MGGCCSYAQDLPTSGDFAAEPPMLPPQAGLTPLDLPMSAAACAWPNVRSNHPVQKALLMADHPFCHYQNLAMRQTPQEVDCHTTSIVAG